MKRNRIGGTRTAVTELGLGTAQLGDLYRPSSLDEARRIVEAAWRGGIRYFDTAPFYGLGLAETRLGHALVDYERSEFAISSKVGRVLTDGEGAGFRWDFSAQGVRESLTASLDRLGTGYVDIALIHDPQGHLDWAMEEALPALEDLKREGIVRAIGVGSGVVDALIAFAETQRVDALMIAGRYTLLEQPAAERLMPLCVERGVSVLNAGVFNSGLLAVDDPGADSHYEYAAAAAEQIARAHELAGIAHRFDTTLPQAALAFAALAPRVASVVVGAESPEQVTRNVTLYDDREKAAPMLDYLEGIR